MTTTTKLEKDLLASPFASYWLKDAIRKSGERDIVDALSDAEQLVQVLRAKLDAINLACGVEV